MSEVASITLRQLAWRATAARETRRPDWPEIEREVIAFPVASFADLVEKARLIDKAELYQFDYDGEALRALVADIQALAIRAA
jgi:hypothetical protein